MGSRLRSLFQDLGRHASRPWYVPLLALLAGLDLFVLVVPTDGLVVAAAMLRPRQWLTLGLTIAVGATLGALALGQLTHQFEPAVLSLLRIDAVHDPGWLSMRERFAAWGGWAVFLCAAGPFPLQPGVVVASLAGMPAPVTALAVLAGRVSKYRLLAWAGAHAPRLLGRLWGVRGELEALAPPEAAPSKAG